MNICNPKSILAVALVVVSLGAIAAPANGLYLGINVGGQKYPDNVNGINGDGSATSGKLYVGYQLNSNFSIETGIAELGSISNSIGQIDGQSAFIDAVGFLPMSDQWSLLGRIGAARVNLNTSLGNDSGNGLKVGLGAQYMLTNTVLLSGEWERYQPSVFCNMVNIDQYSIGLKVTF